MTLNRVDQAYAENTTIIDEGDWVSIKCKKGLWSVDAPTLDGAEREAKRYFQQYYHDGEYGS